MKKKNIRLAFLMTNSNAILVNDRILLSTITSSRVLHPETKILRYVNEEHLVESFNRNFLIET